MRRSCRFNAYWENNTFPSKYNNTNTDAYNWLMEINSYNRNNNSLLMKRKSSNGDDNNDNDIASTNNDNGNDDDDMMLIKKLSKLSSLL